MAVRAFRRGPSARRHGPSLVPLLWRRGVRGAGVWGHAGAVAGLGGREVVPLARGAGLLALLPGVPLGLVAVGPPVCQPVVAAGGAPFDRVPGRGGSAPGGRRGLLLPRRAPGGAPPARGPSAGSAASRAGGFLGRGERRPAGRARACEERPAAAALARLAAPSRRARAREERPQAIP